MAGLSFDIIRRKSSKLRHIFFWFFHFASEWYGFTALQIEKRAHSHSHSFTNSLAYI